MLLTDYAHYYCTSNADAYREICEALGRYTPRPRVNDCIGIKPEQNARATPQEIHQTYSLLLSMLPLTPTHKAHLLSPRRGLTEYQIARFGLKSTPPAFLCRGYAERLRRQGCTLQGVPGFYQDDAGRWTINFGSRTAGILLPAVGLDGLICGMQIRLDTPLRRRDDPPGKSGAKYIWLSSIGKPHGVTSGSPLHFVGEPFAKTVYVTEGLLKADIAHCLTGRSFIAVAGVNSLNGLESALRCMAQNGTKLVVEAYDMAMLKKYQPYVAINLCSRKALFQWKIDNKVAEIPTDVFRYMTAEKFMRYMEAQFPIYCETRPLNRYRDLTIGTLVTTYVDYLHMCRRQAYDMKDKSVLFPKNCAAAHDREAERIQKINDAQKNKAFCMAYAGFARKAALSNRPTGYRNMP